MKIFKKMKKGFTLVELVVVIAVIAILAGVSVGAYFGITDSANNSKLQQEAKTVHTNIQLVGSKGGDNAKLSSSGLYINDLDTFKSDFIQMSGSTYDVLAGSTAPTTISKPTVYFFTASEVSPENIVNGTFKNFAYYTHEVGSKRAVGNVTTGDINVESNVQFIIDTTTNPEEPDVHVCEWNEGEVTLEATCSSTGSILYTCITDSSHTKTETLPINVDAHNYDDGVVTAHPTCTTEGEKTYTCSYDNSHIVTETIAINNEAHDWNTEPSEVVPATCSSTGLKTFTCKHNASHTKTEVIPVDSEAHNFDDGEITTTPTCTSTGIKTFICSYNEDHTRTETVEINGEKHDWNTEPFDTLDATCTTEGYKKYTCKHNNAHIKTDILPIDKDAHKYNSGEVTTEPTCTSTGVKTFTCEYNNDHKDTQVIDAAEGAHEWNETPIQTVASTCSKAGYEVYSCKHNDKHTKTVDLEIDSSAHDWDDGVISTNSTCSVKGVKTLTCKHNSSHTKTELLDLNSANHTWSNGTCTGCSTVCSHESYNSSYVCDRCGFASYVIYLKPNENWLKDNARFAARFYKGEREAWVDMTDKNSDGIYEAFVPYDFTDVIYVRLNPTTTENNWENKWNQTIDLKVPSETNRYSTYVIEGNNWDRGYWSKPIYLGVNDLWPSDGARFAVYVFNKDQSGEWFSMYGSNQSGIYEAFIKSGYSMVIFGRMNPSTTDNNFNDGVRWNQTGDLNLPTDGKNLFTLNKGSWSDGNWSTKAL